MTLATALLLAVAVAKGAPLDHAACVRALEPPTISGPADLAGARRLDDAALKALLVGHTLRDPSTAPPVIHDIAYLEWFRSDGQTWLHTGGRGGGGSGTYVIADSRVCVTTGGRIRCREVWSTPKGHYFVLETQPGGGLTVQPVSIEAGLAPQDGPRPKAIC